MANAPHDQNREKSLLLESDLSAGTLITAKADSFTGRLKVDALISSSEASGSDIEGGVVTIGTTAVEITFTGTTRGIQIQSDHSNTGYIYIGLSTVTNLGANAFAKLLAGDSLYLDYDDTSKAIYAVSNVAGQTIYKVAIV